MFDSFARQMLLQRELVQIISAQSVWFGHLPGTFFHNKDQISEVKPRETHGVCRHTPAHHNSRTSPSFTSTSASQRRRSRPFISSQPSAQILRESEGKSLPGALIHCFSLPAATRRHCTNLLRNGPALVQTDLFCPATARTEALSSSPISKELLRL